MTVKVLVPMDDSEMARHALECAIEFHPGAEITVLNVVGTPSSMLGAATGLAMEDDFDDAAEAAARPALDAAREIAATAGVDIRTTVEAGHPVRAILNRAEEFDVVVIGSHSGSLADRLFVGNVTEKIVRQLPVPVTVAR